MTGVSSNSGILPLRTGDFDTLSDALDYAAKGKTGFRFFDSQGRLIENLPFADLRERAVALALRLNAAGLKPGERFAIVAETGPDFMVFFFGCQYAGLIPVPLPLNVNLGAREGYVESLRNMLVAASVSGASAPKDWFSYLEEAAVDLEIKLLGEPQSFYDLSDQGGALHPHGKDDPCYIQYSSGSTSFPKGVLGTQRSVTSNARAIARHGLNVGLEDHGVSWLPLYHDMGLVGFCITPMVSQLSLDYLSVSAFARRPLIWLKLMSEARATAAFSPTFGYELCLRAAERRAPTDLDLSNWRVAGIGGEMIRPSVLRRFAETFAPFGFDEKAFLPSYGLAESTLAVTFCEVGQGVRLHKPGPSSSVPSKGAGYSAGDRAYAICGRILPEHELKIADSDGNPLPEGQIGGIYVLGPSVMAGYFSDAQASKETLGEDGWLKTGDLGYLHEGELIITGREKDLIIQNGRNIWPQDLEWAIEKIEGVRASGVAAGCLLDAQEVERVVIVAETRYSETDDLAALEKEIHASVHQVAGLNCDVVLTAPRALVRTSSGKLSRAGSFNKLRAGQLPCLNQASDLISSLAGGDRFAHQG